MGLPVHIIPNKYILVKYSVRWITYLFVTKIWKQQATAYIYIVVIVIRKRIKSRLFAQQINVNCGSPIPHLKLPNGIWILIRGGNFIDFLRVECIYWSSDSYSAFITTYFLSTFIRRILETRRMNFPRLYRPLQWVLAPITASWYNSPELVASLKC